MDEMKNTYTLGTWIPEWLRCYKEGTIMDSSFHQLELLAELIPDNLKNMELTEILPKDLQAFYNYFGQTASKSYMDKMRVMVNGLFREATENGLISKNPTGHLKVPRCHEEPREAFTFDEVKIILEHAMSYQNARTATAIMTLLLTGIRRGELLGLSWDDITDNTLTINRSVSVQHGLPTFTEHEAKTKASLRTVPLLPELAFRLQSLPHLGRFIFCTESGKLLHPRNFSRDYKRFFEQLHEVAPDVRYLSPHCCRHTFATLTLGSGTDVRVVQQLLGHSNIKTTANYTHPDMDMMRKAVSDLRANL